MFSGEDIPPNRKFIRILRKLKIVTSEAEEAGWEFGLLLVTMVAKSTRHLEKISGAPNMTEPHQIAYDAMLAHVERASIKK
jgi:hypothetical protein